jgi:tetratricopeptide (TPR) repeat protein
VGSEDLRGPTLPRIEGLVSPVDVPDTEFAHNLHEVLRDGKPSAQRLGVLVGVVRRQLAHAGQRFAGGHDGRGTDSVLGALYLVRTGEGRGEMVDAAGEKALAGAITRVSARGDEGRAEALLRMRAAALDPNSPARREIEEHLAAIAAWKQSTHVGTPVRRVGSEERAAVARALVDPSDAALTGAVTAVGMWIARAIELNIQFRQTGQRPEREEAIEAERALESGGQTMAALFLRNGDARGALEALDQTGARRIIPPTLYMRIRNAAMNDAAADWQALAVAFASRDPDERDVDTDLDPELLAAGLWGTSLEAYRRDPGSFDACMLVARSLVRMGMPEAAPLVLMDGLGRSATAANASAALELSLAAIGDSAEIDDLDAARRTFRAAAPVIQVAERPELRGRVEPTAARARFVMAGIEVRAGNLAEARPLLTRAVADEPSASGFTTLALVERQAGDYAAALADVDRAVTAPDARSAPVDVAEARVVAFELLRDGGQDARAKTALDAALAATLAARAAQGNAAQRARAERLLGRVLEGYGDAKGAARALERAVSLAGSDRSTLGAAMLDAIGRALVRHDLGAARAALKRGIEGDVSEEDLVYGGLWVSLLERELKAQGDGTSERALRAGPRGAWTGKLTAWASGKINDAELSTAAQSASQRVEAAFYTAMARRVAGDPSAQERLKAVAGAPVIDLLEVQLARDLTAPRMRADLPGGVQIP